MSERIQNLGKRVELRQKRLRLVTEAEALRNEIRRGLPLDEDVAGLDHSAVLTGAIALGEVLTDLEALDKRLAILDRELGDGL